MESGSDDFSDEQIDEVKPTIQPKGKGKAKSKDNNKDAKEKAAVKRRSSKACDNCRKSKCKCARILDPITGKPAGACENCLTAGTECKFEGATRKRGPPKGYIEAIESRLHRMEALLGGLLGNEDPRAQALLGELIGDEEAREVLAKDLQAATSNPGKKSWHHLQQPPPQPPQPTVSRGFGSSPAPSSSAPPVACNATPRWFSEEDLTFPLPTASPPEASASQSDILTEPSPSLPRQRRKVQQPSSGTSPAASTSAFHFQNQTKPTLAPNMINHTGQATYHLSQEADLSPQADQGREDSPASGGGGMTELADVVGQLSLNENAEVRYHGRSSGLYLISKSSKYRDFFWRFPKGGVWPSSEGTTTEQDILDATGIEDPLPDRKTQQHLLDLYWCYVHPHFPILYQVSFIRQYRHSLDNPNSTEPSTPAGSGKVPVVLLLAMFALAARFSDIEPPRTDGAFWTAGQEYLEKAKKILNYDYESSKLVSVQTLLLMAYREIGTGAMSASWLFTGMAIRMAQDLGLFRDVEKWYLPVQRFSHEEKQTRKRAWWGCIILDRYTASYIGRPGTIHERDYDTSFPSEDEPDEHEQWRPLRPDGTNWSQPPKSESDEQSRLTRYPPTKAHTMSCFNAAGALAVIVNRIIANIYAIRIRVLGQSSETLLSLLDQSLASWYLALPPHLSYNPAAKRVPPPHVLALHLQFYSALILLHRPFIPGQSSESSTTHFPSHAICTTSANAVANIVTVFSKTFTLRQCPPFLIYPIFSAAVICVYNAGFDEGLAGPAKIALWQCMQALQEMEMIWGSAARQRELLEGLVDLRDSELHAQLQTFAAQEPNDTLRGTKRPAEGDNFAPTPVPSTSRPANFHKNPLSRPATAGVRGATETTVLAPSIHGSGTTTPLHPLSTEGNSSHENIFSFPPFSVSSADFGLEGAHQSFDILGNDGTTQDLSQLRAFAGTLNGVTNFSDLLSAYLPSTEAAGQAARNDQVEENVDYDMAFFGMPLGSGMSDDWASYIPQAFFPPDQNSGGDDTMLFEGQ